GPGPVRPGPPGRPGRSALVGVGGDGRRNEGLLDRPRAGPARQVLGGAGLVVGAGGAAAAEGLLPDDRAGRLVVDVEVAGGEPEGLQGLLHRGAVVGDDGAGQRVGGALVDGLEDALVVAVLVDVHRDDRAEIGRAHV